MLLELTNNSGTITFFCRTNESAGASGEEITKGPVYEEVHSPQKFNITECPVYGIHRPGNEMTEDVELTKCDAYGMIQN